MSQISLTLFGKAPWGFRCSGGIEHSQPMIVTRISPGTIADKAGVKIGDIITSVNGGFIKGFSSHEFEALLKDKTSLHLVLRN